MFNQTLLGQFFLKRVGKHHNLKYSWTCYRAAQCGRRWWWVGFHYCWQGILIPSSGCYEVAVAYWSSNSQNGSTICNMKYLLKLFNKYFVLQINDCMMETSCWQLWPHLSLLQPKYFVCWETLTVMACHQLVVKLSAWSVFSIKGQSKRQPLDHHWPNL